ncbi:hypothetical protein JTE90_018523 [Oedothorax gibbosus]|uniref:Uncharacterized protein n=1 Tax=Oedothorax gibbosus TaxID=931172 RepID=A0AAV6UN26_9ARAC|nr:hypothetical protein JTE90_018523 [Oedothorax gibbosus]
MYIVVCTSLEMEYNILTTNRTLQPSYKKAAKSIVMSVSTFCFLPLSNRSQTAFRCSQIFRACLGLSMISSNARALSTSLNGLRVEVKRLTKYP